MKLILLLSLSIAPAWAQGNAAGQQKLAFIIPDLYGPQGLKLPNPTHDAHFDSAFQTNFGPFNTAIASQLTSLPLPSPASGFIFSLDPSLGVPTRTAQSFGPIFAERAETIGKGKFVAGFNTQFFRFKTLDGLDLSKMSAVFEHTQTTADPDFKKDIITTRNFFDMAIDQRTLFFTYGVHDRVDLSIAAPFVSARLDAVSNATILRLGTGNIPDKADAHYFLDASGNHVTQKQFSSSGTASGIGDVTMRVKGTVLQTRPLWIAAGLDLRMPTGDAYDFLGSGALGLKPFVALSGRGKRLSPHFNAGYQWNGQSVLAGDIANRLKATLPRSFHYAVGFDAGVSKTFTVAVDVLGTRLSDALRVRQVAYAGAGGGQFPQIGFVSKPVNVLDGSFGFKFNPIGTLLVTFNMIVQANDAGLRGRFTPMLGISYTL